jgi:hypothetical protein
MKLSDLLQLPPGVLLAFAILIWPALWAAALVVVALVGDLTRRRRRRPPTEWRHAA